MQSSYVQSVNCSNTVDETTKTKSAAAGRRNVGQNSVPSEGWLVLQSLSVGTQEPADTNTLGCPSGPIHIQSSLLVTVLVVVIGGR